MWQKGGAGAGAGDLTKVKMVKGRMGRMINGKFFDHMGGLMGGVGMGMGMPAMPSMMLGGVMGMGTGGSSSIFGGTKSNFHNPLMPASSLLGDAGTQVPVDPYAGHGMMSNHVSSATSGAEKGVFACGLACSPVVSSGGVSLSCLHVLPW